MTSRERVKRAIRFMGTDRLPHFLPDGKPDDIIWLWPERPAEKQAWQEVDGHDRRVDEWGVVWERAEKGSFGEAVEWPVADITRQSDFVFPPSNEQRFYDGIRHACRENNERDDAKYALAVMPVSSLNEGTHNVMGLHNMFVAYYEHPDDLKALVGRFAAAQRESIKTLAACGCDGVMGYDDWGLQDRLMVGLDMIEEFFMPHYRENWKLAHDLGMDVWMHSCGYTIELLPLLAEAGLNVAQLDQQENMGLENLDATVGGKLAFWCPVDVQKTMVTGTPSDIEAYVRRMMATIGNHKGGLVSMAYSTPEAVGHTQENIEAMCAAFRKYGVYDE